MYESYDGKQFATQDEVYKHENKRLHKMEIAITLSIHDVVIYYVQSDLDKQRVIQFEKPLNSKPHLFDIQYPSWMVTYSTDDSSEFYMIPLEEAKNKIVEYVRNKEELLMMTMEQILKDKGC